MTLRPLVLASFLFLIAFSTSAQTLMHSFGANISIMTAPASDPYNSSKFTMSQTSFCYFPRYNFVENENSSVSVGAPIGLGFGIARNTTESDMGIAFAYDIPIVLDYNIGCKSTIENENTFGGYFGAGFGYHKVNISHSEYSNFNGASYGPIARAGVRIGSMAESWGGHAITIGLFYKKGLEKQKFNTFGFNVLYDL